MFLGKMFYFLIVLSVYVDLSESDIQRTPKCELRDAYGYDNIPNSVDYYDWALAFGPSSTDSTGPSSNRANETDGCYLLHQTFIASPSEFTILVSPCYTALDPVIHQPSLRFFHYTYGQDVGSFGAYLRSGCLQPGDWTTDTVNNLPGESDFIWEIIGSQNNSWTEVKLPLGIPNTSIPFQIVFELFEGNGNLSDIALDEIDISGITCYPDDLQTFLCDNSSCIPVSWVCDNFLDCIDGTDEPAPGCCNPYTKFLCNNSRCIDADKRCDGIDDCTPRNDTRDTSDEDNCPGSSENQSMSIIPATLSTITEMSMTDLTKSMTTATLLTNFKETTYNITPETTRQVATINFDDANDTNQNATFCEKNMIISGLDNCSFIGIIVALGLIMIVFAIWIITRIINRCIVNPNGRKSRAVSKTMDSLVPDIPEWNTDAGQDNKATIGETTPQPTSVNGVAVVVNQTYSINTTRVASNGINSDHVAVLNEINPEEGSENVEMKTIPKKDITVGDCTETEITKPNMDKDHRVEAIPIYAEVDNCRKSGVIEDSHSDRNAVPNRYEAVDKQNRDKPQSNSKQDSPLDRITMGTSYDDAKKQPNDEAPSTPEYAVPDKSRNSDLIKDSSAGLSARKNSYEDVDMNRNVKTPSAPVYAKPDKSRNSNEIQDPQLGSSVIDNSYEDVDMNPSDKKSPTHENSTPESRNSNLIPNQKPENNLITPYAETEIKAGSAASSSEGDNGLALESTPDKRKSSQASTNSMGLDGYSKVQSKPVDDSDMYEEVKVGEMDKATESRRPTLPEGHPSLRPMSKVKLQTDSKSAGANSLSVIDENHNADIGLYAEANFDSTESVTEQTKDKGNSSVVKTVKDEKRNEEIDNGDQTEWVDNIVYARTSVGT